MFTELLRHWYENGPGPLVTVELSSGQTPVQFNCESFVDMETIGQGNASAMKLIDNNNKTTPK